MKISGFLKIAIFACVAVLFPVQALAKYVAVLETTADPKAAEKITQQERQFLTDVLRGEAVKQLPAQQNFTIMTRENINVMLPPGKSIEDCEGSCLAETGKNIAADYVAQARVTMVGGGLAISAEMYETAGNKLLTSFSGRGENYDDLEKIIMEEATEFFRAVKASEGSWGGAVGFADVSQNGDFSFAGKTKFIVEIETVPSGALPTVDGKGFQKCTSTPCKVQLESGEHRFVASMERYEDAETVVDVTGNNQKISLTLNPNYGVLNLFPVISLGKSTDLQAQIDGMPVNVGPVKLDPGVHTLKLNHPCYDPMEVIVGIEKGKTEAFQKSLNRGKGALILDAEWAGEPQAVPVYIDGTEVGSTPFEGEVPLCATVIVGDEGKHEVVDVDLKWHQVVKATHNLKHDPAKVVITGNDEIRKHAQEAYAELDGREVSKSNTPEEGTSIPTEVSPEKGKVHWVPVGISAAVMVTGSVLAVLGNSKAKSAYDKEPANTSEYKKNKDDIRSAQTLRTIGIVTAIVGAVGLGVSFAF